MLNFITDRQSLLRRGSVWFRQKDFSPYGMGVFFATIVLRRSARISSQKLLEEIADALGLPDVDLDCQNNDREKQRGALKAHGITDRQSLLRRGSVWFMNTEFPPYGQGVGFAGAILERTIRPVKLPILNEIVDVLGLPEIDFDRQARDTIPQRNALINAGIPNRTSLLGQKTSHFSKMSFPPYKMAIAFAGTVLGRRVDNITKSVLIEVADILFPEKPSKR